MPDTELITPSPHPVLTSLCRLIGERLGADLVIVTDIQHAILASHSWPLSLTVPPLGALMTADMLVLTDTTHDPRFEPLADAMGGFRTGFYAAARLKTAAGEPVGSLYLLRQKPRTFERQHYQAFLDAVCLASDYLVQQRALTLARQVEARLLPFESGVESLSDAVIAYSDAGRITYANPAAGILFDTPVDEFVGRQLTAVIPGGPGTLPEADPHTWQLGHAEGRTLTGTVLHLDVASRQLQVDSTHCTLLIQDVSRQHANVAALAQSQLHTQALLQAIPDALLVLSKDGVVLTYKPDSLRLKQDPVGRNMYQVWPLETAERIMLYLQLTLQLNRRSQSFTIKSPSGTPAQELKGRLMPMGTERALLVISNLSLDRVSGSTAFPMAPSTEGQALPESDLLPPVPGEDREPSN